MEKESSVDIEKPCVQPELMRMDKEKRRKEIIFYIALGVMALAVLAVFFISHFMI